MQTILQTDPKIYKTFSETQSKIGVHINYRWLETLFNVCCRCYFADLYTRPNVVDNVKSL